MIACGNVDEMLFAALSDCFTQGQETAPREQETLEVLAWSALLRDPRARLVKNEARDVRKGYCAASVAWNLAKRNDVESIVWWNPGGKYISDDERTFHGANYGQRWNGYLDEAILLLEQDPHTRRAWVPIWNPEDLVGFGSRRYSREGKDVPCTLGFALRRHYSQLHMQVVMRSQNTMVLPYDVFLFSVLLELIANELGLDVGALTWYANSLHLYRRREYAMNRATYEWHKDRLMLPKSANYEWHRTMQEPMERIEKTLTQATRNWPAVMDEAMESEANCRTMLEKIALDPIEQLIVTDGLRKHTES